MPDAKKAGSRTAAKKPKRRWRIPPPLLRDAEAPGPEGLYVLEELPSELGMVIWKSLRNVLLWAQVEPRSREDLFVENAAERRRAEILSVIPEKESELRASLEGIVPILADSAGADPEAVALACTRLSAWAETKRSSRTALEFMQAASLACPANPRFALAVARGARDLAHYARAEAWFYRTVGLSRQVKDWETYIRAYLAHGKMLLRKGALPAAQSSFIKARRRASRQGLRAFEAMSYHEIFVLEIAMGNYRRALAYAERAAKAYGTRHEDFPILAHDVAYYWMQQGNYEQALPVFSEVLQKVPPIHQPTVLGSVARASAGLGDREGFQSAVAELERAHAGPGVAESWVEVARGAVLLGDHEHAARAARYAEGLARERKEGQVRFLAESVLEAAEAEARAVAARKVRLEEETAEDRGRHDELARKLLRTLKAGAGAGRG
jgi:tetratricopeptide (TPR) repeat protein